VSGPLHELGANRHHRIEAHDCIVEMAEDVLENFVDRKWSLSSYSPTTRLPQVPPEMHLLDAAATSDHL
jgi:hypothetical protein